MLLEVLADGVLQLQEDLISHFFRGYGILKQSAKEFAKYNQLYPDQFLPLQRDMIGKFGAAKDQWFSSFLLQVENHSSWHRLFVDPLSRAMYSSDGPDFEFVQQKRKEGLSIHEAVWQLAWKKSGPEMASLEAWLEEHEKYRSVACTWISVA